MLKATKNNVFNTCDYLASSGRKPSTTLLLQWFNHSNYNHLCDKLADWKATKTKEELAAIYDKPVEPLTDSEKQACITQLRLTAIELRLTKLEESKNDQK